MEQTVKHAREQAERPTRRDGECEHHQRLVGMRSRHLHTLMGNVTFRRAYDQCVVEEKEAEQGATCRSGGRQRDEPAQECTINLLGKRVARMTLAETVETFCSILPLPLSERQVLHLIQPVGESFESRKRSKPGIFSSTQPTHRPNHLNTGPCLVPRSSTCPLKPME